MVTSLFEHLNYRAFMTEYFRGQPREGFGQLSKTAKALGIQPSLLTVIMQGSKNLTNEQALAFAELIGLTDLETDYFTLLVSLERAGTERLRKRLSAKLRDVRDKSNLLKQRFPPTRELPEQIKAQFYSQWFYSAIRMASSLESTTGAESIATHLGLDRQTVARVLEFLVTNGLVEERDGRYHLGPQSTNIGSGEMLVSRHHTNWRLKAIEHLSKDATRGLHFTSPVSISVQDLEKVRKVILSALEDVFAVVDPSPSETVACLCIDWFQVGDRA